MSIIRSIKARLGLSVTPANNFVLDASADNGTMKLARESGQDIMTVDAAGKVAFPQNAQTWQVVVRVSGQDYVNNTGRDIDLAITVQGAVGGNCGFSITVQGVAVAQPLTPIITGQANRAFACVRIPAGATYSWTFSFGLSSTILELR